MHFRVGTNNWKYLVWSLHTELRTRSVWKEKLHAGLELCSLLLSFIALVMEFREIKQLLSEKNKMYARDISFSRFIKFLY